MTYTPAPDAPADNLVRLGVKPPLGEYLRQIWARRDFAVTVPLGELRAQNMNSVLGSLWHLLNPLLQAGVYYVIFGVLLGARGDADNYVAFLITGLFVFYFTQKAMTAGSRTVISNLPLIQSMSFPRAVLPLSAVLAECLAQLPAIATMLVLVLVTGEPLHLGWLLLVPAYLLQAMFNLGVAFVSARLTFHFRDMEQLLPYFIRLWFYLSGIFFGAERVPEGWLRTLFELNPVYVYITVTRQILLQESHEPRTWLYAVAWALVALLVGFLYFRGHESEYGRGY